MKRLVQEVAPRWAEGQYLRWGHSCWGPLPFHSADDPEVQVLHSIGHSAAPRLSPLAWAVLLLPFLLLQTS